MATIINPTKRHDDYRNNYQKPKDNISLATNKLFFPIYLQNIIFNLNSKI